MEKIQERNLKWLWVPQALVIPAVAVAILFALIPVVGWYFSAVFFLAAVGFAGVAVVYKHYFYYQLSLDVNAVCEGDGLENQSYLFVLALNSITFGIYSKYWIYKLGQRLQANAPRYGFKMVIGGKDFLILDLLSAGWISAWEFIRNMNRIASVYNQTGLADVVGGAQ